MRLGNGWLVSVVLGSLTACGSGATGDGAADGDPSVTKLEGASGHAGSVAGQAGTKSGSGASASHGAGVGGSAVGAGSASAGGATGAGSTPGSGASAGSSAKGGATGAAGGPGQAGGPAKGGATGASGSASAAGGGANPSCAPSGGKSDQHGCACTTNGATQPCFVGNEKFAGVGACGFGKQSCVQVAGGELQSFAWGACAGSGVPSTETCNGADDNCDGTVDEGCQCKNGDVDTTYCQANCPNGGGQRVCTNGMYGACTCKCTPEACSTVCGAGTRTCDANGKLGACNVAPTTTTCLCPDGSQGTSTCANDQVGACQCKAPPSKTCTDCIESKCSWAIISAESQGLGNDTSQCKGSYDAFLMCVATHPGSVYYNGPCDQAIGGCDGPCGCGNIIRLTADCASQSVCATSCNLHSRTLPPPET